MEPLVVVLLVLLVLGGAVLSWWLKQRRREEWSRVASGLGFRYSHDDPFGLVGLPFPIFGKGDGRGVENVAWGEYEGNEVRTFEYWYYDESTDSKGNTSRDYSRFTCAVTTLPSSLPSASIAPESLWTRLADHVGFRDVEFESEEFNRAFQVKSPDRRFVTYLVDARMMGWLLAARPGWTFEIAGPWLLAYGDRMSPSRVPVLLAAVDGFRDHVPDVVWEVFGEGTVERPG